MEQQLKQQLMQKKIYANLSQKKKKVQFFPSYHSQKIVLPTIKKNTILHHHIKKSHTHFKMISNHIKKNCTKAFYEKKKETCMRKINNKKKNIDEIPPIHINFYLKSSSLICQSYISISLFLLF